MRLKKISEILGRLIDVTMINTHELNDFSVGSTIRSIYEAVSMELEQYYILGRENILWGIEQGVLNAFDFRKREAKRAYGMVTLEFHTVTQTPVYVPTGTTFDSSLSGAPSNLTFQTMQDYVIPAGVVTAKVEVYCTTVGSQGNIAKGRINRVINNISNLKKVYNEYDILTGTDEESIESVKKRFHAFVESRGRATIKALDYGTRQVEEVSGVYIKEEVGYVRIYAHDLNGDLKDETLAKIKTAIEDYRPAGIKLDVFPVVKLTVPIDVTVTISNKNRINTALEERIELTIRNYLNSRTVSETLVKADLLQAIMNIDDNLIYDCEINNLSGNLDIRDEEIIRAGDVTIELI